ncbi:N-acyl-D-amino-acid deacylase family protein [Sphingomonas asaccharolytica]|uniref:N-acyl-D-amino-acid deacylase family protein n=1 Tax=Sphingomonas asaccharolytica TaxID=40681 RepID=UPI000836BCAB|nr:amidohydrolase family protein [Sphingomonas asaccharolytica]
MRLLPLAASLLLLGASPAPQYDIVIRHGHVLDGAGNPWVAADIAIKDGRIARIGAVDGAGRREIDATGLYVSPGFIDMMDQSGEVLLKSGGAENKLRMGVTTLIAGEGGTPVDAAKITAYFTQLERQGIAVNFGTYYSAAQARVKVMGDGAGHPSAAQLDAMRHEVAAAMHAGVFGISSALIYSPDTFQSTDDLIALAKESGKCGGFYATHMRDESAKILSAIDEAIRIGEDGRVKVEIFHLKAAFQPLAGKLMPQALARIAAARDRGVDVAADVYPYTAGGTGIDITIPTWVFADGQTKGWERLKDPAIRARLKREVAAGSQPDWSNLVEASGGWDHVVLANAFDPKYDKYDGQSFAAIGKALGRDPEDVAWDIAGAALPNRAMALFFMMDEGDIDLALKQPWTSIGTDAGASAKFGEMDALGLPHPRAYGTFPRILGVYARDRGVLTLPDAVRKMTSWPAARMGLADRGVLREGLRADLVVFDYAKVAAGSDWAHPMAPPVGIEDVIVNGVLAVDRERATGSRSGMVLRHRC